MLSADVGGRGASEGDGMVEKDERRNIRGGITVAAEMERDLWLHLVQTSHLLRLLVFPLDAEITGSGGIRGENPARRRRTERPGNNHRPPQTAHATLAAPERFWRPFVE